MLYFKTGVNKKRTENKINELIEHLKGSFDSFRRSEFCYTEVYTFMDADKNEMVSLNLIRKEPNKSGKYTSYKIIGFLNLDDLKEYKKYEFNTAYDVFDDIKEGLIKVHATIINSKTPFENQSIPQTQKEEPMKEESLESFFR